MTSVVWFWWIRFRESKEDGKALLLFGPPFSGSYERRIFEEARRGTSLGSHRRSRQKQRRACGRAERKDDPVNSPLCLPPSSPWPLNVASPLSPRPPEDPENFFTRLKRSFISLFNHYHHLSQPSTKMILLIIPYLFNRLTRNPVKTNCESNLQSFVRSSLVLIFLFLKTQTINFFSFSGMRFVSCAFLLGSVLVWVVEGGSLLASLLNAKPKARCSSLSEPSIAVLDKTLKVSRRKKESF